MKRLIIFLLAITLISPVQVRASESSYGDAWIVKNSANSIYLQNRITGEVILDAFELDNTGRLVKVDLIAYADQLNSMSLTSNSSPDANVVEESPERRLSISYSYEEYNAYTELGSAIKVSPDLTGPGQITIGVSVSVGESFGGQISIGGTIKEKIELGASFNWSSSANSSTNFSGGFPVPEGVTAYVNFRPRFHVTEGTLTQYVTTDSITSVDGIFSVWGRCPVTLPNGLADGVYELATY